MKYLKVFETESDQLDFRDGEEYIEPHVSCLEDGSKVKYNKFALHIEITYQYQNNELPNK